MKEKLNAGKEYLANLSRKTKIIAAGVLAAIVVGAVIITVALNHKDYVTLFTNVTEDETTEILAKLQEMQVQYTSDGSVQVLSAPGGNHGFLPGDHRTCRRRRGEAGGVPRIPV